VKGPIRDSRDVLRIFSGLSIGQQHHLNRALRALFNYLEILGWSRGWLDSLRKAIPKDRIGIDLHVPEPGEILESMRRLPGIPLKYRALWSLCLDSGARMIEAIRIIGEFREDRLMEADGFCRYEVAAFRGSKQAYYAYFLPETLSLIQEAAGIRIERRAASSYFSKRALVSPKYLRKYAFDRMIELGVPESVADFIEGRVPRRIGAKHYMALRRQADRWYPRYAEYLKALRRGAA
jgi:intergrase/recombinase